MSRPDRCGSSKQGQSRSVMAWLGLGRPVPVMACPGASEQGRVGRGRRGAHGVSWLGEAKRGNARPGPTVAVRWLGARPVWVRSVWAGQGRAVAFRRGRPWLARSRQRRRGVVRLIRAGSGVALLGQARPSRLGTAWRSQTRQDRSRPVLVTGLLEAEAAGVRRYR